MAPTCELRPMQESEDFPNQSHVRRRPRPKAERPLNDTWEWLLKPSTEPEGIPRGSVVKGGKSIARMRAEADSVLQALSWPEFAEPMDESLTTLCPGILAQPRQTTPQPGPKSRSPRKPSHFQKATASSGGGIQDGTKSEELAPADPEPEVMNFVDGAGAITARRASRASVATRLGMSGAATAVDHHHASRKMSDHEHGVDEEISAAGMAGKKAQAVLRAELKFKVEAKRFEAPLLSFQELINVEGTPTTVGQAMEKLRSMHGGPNFVWERTGPSRALGSQVTLTFPLVLWCQNMDLPDTKTRQHFTVRFLHKQGCCYIYQPVLPITSLLITPKWAFRSMFDFHAQAGKGRGGGGGSFHTLKMAWRNFLDFGSSDYRLIVGEQLERWTQRFKTLIEKPFNATYWLLLMVGSHFRETMVKRQVLKPQRATTEKDAEHTRQVPVICIDSFVALSALLFSPERQVLYAGTDPTPAYLQWLQHIGEQHASRKNVSRHRGRQRTVFETNEFLDLPTIIVFYGRLQHKAKENSTLSWVGNPALVKSFLMRFMEDNQCEFQLEHALRLYSYSCAVGLWQRPRSGRKKKEEDTDSFCSSDEEDPATAGPWYCWNGLKTCEIGVPFPSTQASFLSPFVTTKQVALLCPVHGPEAVPAETPAKEPPHKDPHGSHIRRPSVSSIASGDGDKLVTPVSSLLGRTFGRQRSSMGSIKSARSGTDDSSELSAEDTDGEENESHGSWSHQTGTASTPINGAPPGTPSHHLGGSHHHHHHHHHSHHRCICHHYIVHKQKQAKPFEALSISASYTTLISQAGKDGTEPSREDPDHPVESNAEGAPETLAKPTPGETEVEETLRALGEPDLFYAFVGILSGGLNFAKQVVRLHFSIDPSAYERLPSHPGPGTGKSGWTEALLPWYCEFHKPDAHGRSRYGMLLQSTLRGMLGDGYVSGLNDEVLDIVRVGLDKRDSERDLAEAPSSATNRKGPTGKLAASLAESVVSLRRGTGSAPTWRQSVPAGGPLISPREDQAQDPGSPKKAPVAQTGPIAEIVMWTELYECESLHGGYKGHFDNFHQWCHSVHLSPFLLRCYRRCGIAGLATGQHVGGHKTGIDPMHPLVLPTVPNFCYGHCYPLHKVLQYYYGGMENIVYSTDDPHEVEETRKNSLGLISGQERLNNQCWFSKREERIPTASQALHGRQKSAAKAEAPLSHAKLYEALQGQGLPGEEMGQRHSGRRPSLRLNRSIQYPGAAGGITSPLTDLRSPQARQVALQAHKRLVKRRLVRNRHRPGLLAPQDPFFRFCLPNLTVYTYPAGMLPRQLTDGSGLRFKYSDFISRSGTPEEERGESEEEEEEDDGDRKKDQYTMKAYKEHSYHDGLMPPSICLCQPTEISTHKRDRKPVKTYHVDEKGLILGDAGWFPGALGYRFTFEVHSDDVDKYVRFGVVPQVQLLFLEYRRVTEADKRNRHARRGVLRPDNLEDPFSDDDSSSDSVDGVGTLTKSLPLATRLRAQFFNRQAVAQRKLKNRIQATTRGCRKGQVQIMLPPLLLPQAKHLLAS